MERHLIIYEGTGIYGWKIKFRMKRRIWVGKNWT
jgi:hypothetical protein